MFIIAVAMTALLFGCARVKDSWGSEGQNREQEQFEIVLKTISDGSSAFPGNRRGLFLWRRVSPRRVFLPWGLSERLWGNGVLQLPPEVLEKPKAGSFSQTEH